MTIAFRYPHGFDRRAFQRVCNLLLVAALLHSAALPLSYAPLPVPWTPQRTPATEAGAATDSPHETSVTLDTAQPVFAAPLPDGTSAGVPPAPTSWNGHPELVDRRDAFTRVYDLGDGRTMTAVSSAPRHYRDEHGHWQNDAPRFVAMDGGIVTQGTDLSVSLAQRTSTALMQSATTTVGWRPLGVQALDAAGAAEQPLLSVR